MLRRIALPVLLLAIGVYLLVRCIYIPTFNGVKTGQNYSKKIGDAKSRKPVRVGASTRDDVLRILGVPQASKSDGSGIAYAWTVQNGIAVWPLCFQAVPVTGYRTLVLRFDETGRLTSSEVLKWDEPLINFGARHQPIPDHFRNEQQRPTTMSGQ